MSCLWQLVNLAHRQEDRLLYGEVEGPQHNVAIKFRFSDLGQTASAMVHYVIRRYEENDRLIMVWKAFIEGEGAFRGMLSDETCWCVVYPSNLESFTVMETMSRLVPMHLSSITSNMSLKDQFVSVVLKAGEEDILQISKMLDGLLLDEALLQQIDVEMKLV